MRVIKEDMELAKPRLFIGSATESLDVAYAVQESLEHDAEVTVWTQGIFELSKYTIDALADTVETVDFGVFVLTPTDVIVMRDQTKQSARDNVIFELGMFIGRLGRERAFILLPRQTEELHLPTDLLGITPALYDADRTDGNLVAALGPAANKVRKAIRILGKVQKTDEVKVNNEPTVSETVSTLIEARTDCIAVIESWMGSRPSASNLRALRYSEIDRELGLKPGSAKQYIVEAARRWNYSPRHVGEEVINFEDRSTMGW